MFVPVACSQCGKPFQVPDAAVGTSTACPWCKATVLALPIATPTHAPTATPASKPQEVLSLDPEPLPLDDAPLAKPRSPAKPTNWVVVAILGTLALVVATGATMGYLRYQLGSPFSFEWKAFTPADNSFTVELLGRAVEERDAEAGEKRYVSEGWYSGATAWVGWRDLTQVQIQLANAKDAWQALGPVFDAEREKLRVKYNGTITKDATTSFENPLTREVRMTLPDRVLVARMLVYTGNRPRVYFLRIIGKVDPDGPEVKRFFDSFRVNQ